MDWQDRESPGGHKMSRLVFGMFSSQWLETTKNVSLEFSHKNNCLFPSSEMKDTGGFFFRGDEKKREKGEGKWAIFGDFPTLWFLLDLLVKYFINV